MFFEMPGFDPKTMNDDDIMNNITDISAKLGWAVNSGAGYPVDQLQNMINMLNHEMSERMFMKYWDQTKHLQNAPNDTDPDFREANRIKADIASPKTSQPGRRQRIIRTPKPVIPTDPLNSSIK